MSHPAETTPYLSSLRERATLQLTDGVPHDLTRTSTSEAMAVLYKLASSPATASDALAMLHELQVHQVEVEMQQEELRQSRAGLESELIRQSSRIERAPAAILIVDQATVLSEINLAGARLLGAASSEVLGRPLSSLLTPASSDELQKLLMRARDGAVPETCELQLTPQSGVTRTLLCTADKDVATGRFLLVLMAAPLQG